MALELKALKSVVQFMMEESEIDVVEVLTEKGYSEEAIERWGRVGNLVDMPLDAAVIVYQLFADNYWNADDYETTIYNDRQHLLLHKPVESVISYPVGPGVHTVKVANVFRDDGERLTAIWTRREDGQTDFSSPDKVTSMSEYIRMNRIAVERLEK